MNHFNLLEWLAIYNVGSFFMGVVVIGMVAISLVMLGGWMLSNLRLFNKANTLDQELISLIDERIGLHTRGDAMDENIFGGKESIWNAPHYAKLKSEVSDHLREAELDTAIILIEKQRLKQLEIEELTLRLALAQRGEYHDQP